MYMSTSRGGWRQASCKVSVWARLVPIEVGSLVADRKSFTLVGHEVLDSPGLFHCRKMAEAIEKCRSECCYVPIILYSYEYPYSFALVSSFAHVHM
jgi:hypothetical protein